MKISVVLPVYNEEKVIERTVCTLKNYLAKNFEFYEIIAVNDGSSDKSAEILKSISGIKFVNLQTNHGKGYAVKKGAQISTGDAVIFTDADLCYGAEKIKNMVQSLANSDIAIGRRDVSRVGYSPLRRLFSHTFDIITAPFIGKIADVQCGMKCFSKSSARAIFPYVKTSGFAFDFEILYLAHRMGFKISEIPVTMQKTEKSTVRIIRDPIFMIRDVAKVVLRNAFKNADFEDEFLNEKTHL